MTGPVPPGGEELRERLLGAICRCLGMDPAEADQPEVDDLMRHLIPEVEAEGRRRAAEELRAVLDGPRWVMLSGALYVPSEVVRARAAALAPEEARPHSDG